MLKENPPILAAAFASEAQLWQAVTLLQEQKIGRDFIGVFIGEAQRETIYLVSVLAPTRLHPVVTEIFQRCTATKIGAAHDIRAGYGVLPHPGVIETHDLKLPFGKEYPANRARMTS